MDKLGSPNQAILIIGAGPVGSVLALTLSRAGRRVVLIDSGASSKKICGEGIFPAGWEILRDLGIDLSITQRSSIEALTYHTFEDGERQSVTAPLCGQSYGVERASLLDALTKAVKKSSIEFWPGSRFRDFSFSAGGLEVRFEDSEGASHHLFCGLLVGADGLHSTVRRKAKLQSKNPARYLRWGTRCYFRSPEQRHAVEVTLGQGVESYLTPLGDDLYGLAFLWAPKRLTQSLTGDGPTYERLLPYLPPDLMSHLPTPKGDFWGGERAIGPLEQKVDSVLHSSKRIVLVGDAAGYFDALTGEGLCLGLRQAQSLANSIISQDLESYPSKHRTIKSRHHLVVNALLWLLDQPRLRRSVFKGLMHSPRLFQSVIHFAVEEAPWRVLLSPQLPRFLLHLIKNLI